MNNGLTEDCAIFKKCCIVFCAVSFIVIRQISTTIWKYAHFHMNFITHRKFDVSLVIAETAYMCRVYGVCSTQQCQDLILYSLTSGSKQIKRSLLVCVNSPALVWYSGTFTDDQRIKQFYANVLQISRKKGRTT